MEALSRYCTLDILHSMNAAALGRRLTALRREAGLSQVELARRMGTSQAAVSKIESGRNLPTLPWLERFAAALRRILSHDPIVVGGTAEEYWTAADYHETDLDMCVQLSKVDRSTLAGYGFEREGRHWVSELGKYTVAVEFPESRIDGDEDR